MRLPPLRFRAFERRGTIRLRDAPPRYPWPWGAAGHPAVGTFVIRPARRIAADDLRTRARASPDGLPSGRRPRAARAGGVCGRRMGRGLLCKPASPKWLLAQAISPPPFSRTKPRSGEDPGPFRQWHAHTIDPHRVKVPDSRAADDAHTGDVCRGFRENERRGGRNQSGRLDDPERVSWTPERGTREGHPEPRGRLSNGSTAAPGARLSYSRRDDSLTRGQIGAGDTFVGPAIVSNAVPLPREPRAAAEKLQCGDCTCDREGQSTSDYRRAGQWPSGRRPMQCPHSRKRSSSRSILRGGHGAQASLYSIHMCNRWYLRRS